ncbi:MAG: 3-dehydroquinate synthase, partial [Cyclobacteriaceae bacterium]
MLPEEIEISQNISVNIQAFFNSSDYDKVAVLVDENTRLHCLPLVQNVIKPTDIIEIESGEEKKTLDTCVRIWKELTDNHYERKSLMVNLGGGVIGDMGGFCAATYKRGIDFVNIPTTLLSQVDASIGGKLGIDFLGFKNHIGTFELPGKVFIDTVFLKTLPQRELRSGFAEVIKHCLIADKDYWEIISNVDFEDQNWPDIVNHSVKVKNEVVEEDPFEKGRRKILNFGHTIGHAIESYFLQKDEQRLLHGEAIAAGMICETYLSEKFCTLPESSVKSIENYIIKTFGRIRISQEDIDEITILCLQDKKNEKGIINFSLLVEIGNSVFNVGIEQN